MSKRPDIITIILTPSDRTEWDEADRLQGSADIPPARAAHAHAEARTAHAASAKPEVVLFGPDEASAGAARSVAAAVKTKPKRVKGLADPGLGLWEGLERSVCQERYPRAYKQWLTDPGSVNPPDGEGFEDAVDRIVGALVKAVEKSAKTRFVVVVRPMARAILARWLAGQAVSAGWPPEKETAVAEFTIARGALRTAPLLRASAGLAR